MELQDWVKQERGRSIAIARVTGVTQPVVSDWCSGKKPIAVVHCKAIERFTGGAVTVQEMCPDWQKIWPELDQAHANQAQPATQTVAQSV